MEKRVALEASLAIAEAAKLCDVDVVAAYPITPQTHVVERLAELVASGELNAEYVPVESEHSALSVCCDTSAVGARTFTATSSQGLAYMHEILYIAPVMRLPIVMAVANRALSGPINIWNDHSDIMSERDCGWIQIFAENAQEACDLTIWAFRVAEDQRVSLPTIVNFDGFVLSHMTEALLMPEQETVSKFLPPFKPVQRLDVDNPISMGVVGTVDIYTEAKKQQQETLRQSYATVVNALAEFGNVFGRHYKPVETYRTDDADALLLVMGSIAETAMTAVDRARAKGKKVGLVHPRLWRPFPDQDLLRAIGNAKTLGVVDRAITYGGLGGPVACEVKSALYQQPHRPTVLEFVAGLGGRDVGFDDFEQMFDQMLQTRTNHVAPAMQLVGARE